MSKKIKLFCLPFAGGFASTFLPWSQYADSSLELIPIELAGRGTRVKDPLYTDLKQAVNEIYRTIKKEIDAGPYAFLGHSLGAHLTYELYYKIRLHGHRSPQALFLSAFNPPHCPPKNLKHQLSEQELQQQLLEMGGTNPELFEDKALYEMFLPVLYSDFKMSETHPHKPRKQPIDCELIILNGREDTVTSYDELMEWQSYTSKQMHLHEFDGSHFYINEKTEDVMKVVNKHLFQGGQ